MCRGNRYWITYNGEIYNYVELREELEQLGERFETTSDTEVILAAYARWGADCLSRFNGMWGLAILDIEAQRLFLARDRFGVKPLYVLRDGSSLAFASEIKAFRAIETWRGRMNTDRALDFLVWGISNHSADTMFDGVQQLPGGHLASFDLRELFAHGRLSEENGKPVRWYSLAPRATNGKGWAEEVRSTLDDAVRLRLRADVPVGSCLSGGLDSSSIVCLMSRQLANTSGAGRVRTFTARSDEPKFDESSYAEMVIGAANTEPQFVTPDASRLFAELDSLVWHQDEPFGTTSIFAQRCVFKAARDAGVVVMLDGQGADELLAGYRGYFGAYLAGLVRAGKLGAWAKAVAAVRQGTRFSYARLLGYTAAYAVPSAAPVLGRFDSREYSDRSWIRPAHRDAFLADPIARGGGRSPSVRSMSLSQITATHLPMLLHWEDRNSMTFAVEARVPFLDYRFVELCLGLPDEAKLGGGISKAVLRDSMRGIVPDRVLDRRDKMGFVTAEEVWTTRTESARFRTELASAVDRLDGVLDPGVLKGFDETVAGRRRFDHRYWRSLCLGRWARAFEIA